MRNRFYLNGCIDVQYRAHREAMCAGWADVAARETDKTMDMTPEDCMPDHSFELGKLSKIHKLTRVTNIVKKTM